MRYPLKPKIHSVFRRPPALRYRPPAFLAKIKLGMAALVGLAVVSILFVIFWFVMAWGMRSALEEWVEARRADGYTVGFSTLELGGFPFDVRLTLTDPAVGLAGGDKPWSWQARRLVGERRPWSLGDLRLVLAGEHRLSLVVDGERRTYEGTAREFTADLVLAEGWPESVRLAVAELTMDRAGNPEIALGKAEISVWRTLSADADYRADSLELRIDARGIRLPRFVSLPLGPRIAALELEGSIMGNVMGSVAGGATMESLIAWRDAGGTVEVARIAVTSGPLSLWANGTLALDEALQPIGAFTARVQGFFKTVDLLRKRGLIRARDAVTAKVVLAAFAKKAKDDGRATLSVPLTLQNRRLYAGPVRLMLLPAVRWEESFAR